MVDFEEGRKVTFHQPMSLKPYFLGLVLDVSVDMVLKEGEGGTTVLERDVKLGYPVALRPFERLVDEEFRRESWRTMELLKKHVESLER